MTQPRLQFLVPFPEGATGALPRTVEEYWGWISVQGEIESWGPFSWTLQTYLYLSGAGVACDLVHHVPDEGVVIAHRDFIPDDLQPSPRRFVACILADREQPGFIGHHPWAQFHIVQNPVDRKLTALDVDWPAAFVPYWPQPGLIARDRARSARFERIAFLGYQHNLAPELRTDDWVARLQKLGLEWFIPHRSQWHDYSRVDAVVAVRDFNESSVFEFKPPSKLHNAWRAGVPAILGRESAYRAWRQSGLDYVEVESVAEAEAALRLLRDDPELRLAMVRNGSERAAEVSVERLVGRWRGLLGDLLDRWRAWVALPDEERSAFASRRRAATDRRGAPAIITRVPTDTADVLVFGTGFAAYEFTRTAVARGLTVAVLERGPQEQTVNSASLSAVAYRREPIVSGGATFGARVADEFESLPRFVGFGGTSALWSGKWRRLDRLDLSRSYGRRRWPLAYDELDRWYSAVQRDYDWPDWTGDASFNGFAALASECGLRLVEVFDQDQPLRLRGRWLTLLHESSLSISFGVEAPEPLRNGERDRLQGVRVKSDGRTRDILARHLVTACGGIASVPVSHRLRLAEGAARVASHYGGFMDHPKAVAGRVQPRSNSRFIHYLEQASSTRRLFGFSLPEAETALKGLGNHTAFLWKDDGSPTMRLSVCLEQFPDESNTVSGDDTGSVTWRIARSTRTNAEAFLSEFVPRLERLIGPVTRARDLSWRGSSHHAGALPMGTPGASMVDEMCRFHDVANLYCVSSAVFPVAGSANPTLTIVALARRLGEYLTAGDR